VGLKLNGTHQLPVYVGDVNLLGDNIGSGNIHVPVSKAGIPYGHAVRMKTSTLCCSRMGAISVSMERWTPEYHAFVTETYIKSNDCVVAAQR
jgi:hypothetical protein